MTQAAATRSADLHDFVDLLDVLLDVYNITKQDVLDYMEELQSLAK